MNELFAGEFGDEFQPLHSSGEFPDPVFGSPGRAARHRQVVVLGHGRPLAARGGAAHREARARSSSTTATPSRARSSCCSPPARTPSGTRRSCAAPGCARIARPGASYFGQQQVVDLLAYLRLLHNRYDDEALLTVLASPFVGASNDALVLIRRAASKRPIFTGIEKSLPPQLAERDSRLLRAFRQRFDRLVDASTKLSLELLCERIVAEHDYDLAVLAQWDGRRRYANLRKLARLARSYEELRGADVEGFVRFVARAGGGRRARARGGRGGGGRRRGAPADDPRREGARVQGRRRRGRGPGPPAAGAGRDPRALGRPLRLQGARASTRRSKARAARAPTTPSACASTTSR